MQPSSELRKARRVLDGSPCIELDGDLEWRGDVGLFALRFFAIVEGPTRLVPERTAWYALISPQYPRGPLELVPAKELGLSRTFPHQTHNEAGPQSRPWRDGNVCVDVWGDRIVRGGRREPVDGSRLVWRVERLKLWLQAAASGALLDSGTPFELPHFPLAEGPTFGYGEDGRTFLAWNTIRDRHGIVDLARIGSAYCARRYKSERGRELLRGDFGKRIAAAPNETATWMMVSLPLRLEPWHAPATWGELRAALGVEEPVLSKALHIARKMRAAYLLLGMPMPDVFGGENIQIHWQALRLPELTFDRSLRGFRPLENNFLGADRRGALRDEAPLEWLRSENWSQDQLSRRRSRGLTSLDQRVLLIGCGALGSAVAEILVRSGVRRLTLVDGDVVTGGVLVRTSFGMADIGENKAVALARKLNSSMPHAEVNGVSRHFSSEFTDARGLSAMIVVDCTAEDDVLYAISDSSLARTASFYSFSLSWEAELLYAIGGQVGVLAPASAINALAAVGNGGGVPNREPWSEGIGCYHPAFPADVDRVWRHASTAASLVLGSVVTDSQGVMQFGLDQERDLRRYA